MKHILIFMLLIAPIFANEELEFENDFLSSLDEVSEIATKTKLNIDDTPAFVSVLHSGKLKKLGVSTVVEALSLVPGVQVKKESSGVYVVIFRGASQKGEVKLMVDGVSINNAYRGSIYYYLDFPIELISRIEVIRGPGSVLYGSGAISGVVNIITHSSQESKNELFISAGTYDTYKAGAIFSTKLNEIKVNLDTYYTKSNKSIESGPDLYNHMSKADQRVNDYSVGVNIASEKFSLMARIKKSNNGASHGVFGVLDTSNDNYNQITQTILTQLSYNNKISQNNKIVLKAGYINYQQNIKDQFNANLGVTLKYEEESYFTQAEFISKSIKNNELVIGTNFHYYNANETDVRVANNPINLVNKDSHRNLYALFLSNNYNVNEILTLSAGARYENYSDFGDSLVPNLGAVVKVGDKIRVKATYSNSYRAPSWIELTSNENLNAEKAQTYELGFVYKQNSYNVFRINAYSTKIKGVIKKIGRNYEQESENNFLGTEVEYLFSPNEQIEFSVNASHIDAKDKNGKKLVDIADTIVSSSFIYEFDSGITTGSTLKYLSSSKRAESDVRDDFDDSIIFNQTISYNLDKLTFSFVIKDLFNNGTKYPSLYSTLYNAPLYSNDYSDEGRTFLLKASLEF